MLGPYTAGKNGKIHYRGNKVFRKSEDVLSASYPADEVERRVLNFKESPMWGRIARINHQINLSANKFFNEIGALFTALPLITRMISSPGAVYGKEAINYTTDTSPITLKWFDFGKPAFLAESSQIYLELSLAQQGVDQVYSIYNSFRKEQADATHLPEFHHIEYEGKVTQQKNLSIALGLVAQILKDLLSHNEEDLKFFLAPDRISELNSLAENIQEIPKITFRQALDALYEDTGDDKYKRFTMHDCFGAWEEVRLTEIFGGMIAISQYPLLEIPFYQAIVDGVTQEWREPKTGELKSALVSDNTDVIWPGYRETIGSGHRVRSLQELEEKARIFNLPREDYTPYLQTRQLPEYVQTSGFGLGWERMLQGLLEMPFIWSAAQFPRDHNSLKP